MTDIGHNWTALGVFSVSVAVDIGQKPTGSTTRSPMSVRDDVC